MYIIYNTKRTKKQKVVSEIFDRVLSMLLHSLYFHTWIEYQIIRTLADIVQQIVYTVVHR